MPTDNPLAYERLRTIVADAFRSEFDRVYGDGRQMDAGAISESVIATLPETHFEYRTNEHGVHVRRVTAATAWEVDPDPDGPQTCPQCGGWNSDRAALVVHTKVMHG